MSIDNRFAIVWSRDGALLYLAGDENGVHAAADLADAMRFDTFDEGYAVMQRWKDALGSKDGAVVLPDEIEAQFDPARAAPRTPFFLTAEAVRAEIARVQNDAAEALIAADDRIREAEARRAEVEQVAAIATAALTEIRKDNAELVDRAVATVQAEAGQDV